MTKALALTQREITALCKGAAKAGYAPVLQVGNVFIRLVPEEHVIPPQDKGRIDEEEDIRL